MHTPTATGAQFPWESAGSGNEDTPLCCMPLEVHITADVGIAAWNYYRVTHDVEWLRTRGYPLLEGAADFWASRVSQNADRSYSIKHVVAADEYATDVSDDAFTNAAARENLQAATAAAIQEAIRYLSSRDTEKVGVPLQISYWADWKDVPAVQGRKYAPHFALLWLAALRQAADLGGAMKDEESVSKYAAMADRAQVFINRPFDQGGLWNGNAYADRWDDGRRPAYTLEDQVVGAYFKVIPEEKLQKVYHQLEASETPWGVRDTFPYISGWSQETGGAPGHYHDGGIWPYLNFVDACGRYWNGQAENAEKIIREVGKADLDVNQDDRPGEYLNGDSGADGGFPIQGWDAALFGTIYFGALGLDRPSRTDFAIHVHIPLRIFRRQLCCRSAPEL
jgi:glycogen debranching enzyme